MIAIRSTATRQFGLSRNLWTKKKRKGKFSDETERMLPWAALVQIVEPHCPRAKTGRPPFAVETMLQIHYLQQWFCLSDPAMQAALHDTPLCRKVDQERRRPARPRDARCQEGQPVVLRHEGRLRRRCPSGRAQAA